MKIAIDKATRRTILKWLQMGVIDTDEIEKLSQAVVGLKFPTREDMLKELERLENMERMEAMYGDM